MPRLLATKPLSILTKEANEVGENTLRRSLGPVNLITLGIGAIIGAGIFVLTGQAAALHAGPAVALSFIFAGITCAFAGLCYSEFASIIPIAGSAYTYGYATLGELVAWIIGWDLVLEYAFGAATVASGWSGYFVSLLQQLHITLPPQFTTTYGNVLYFYGEKWQPLASIPVERQRRDPASRRRHLQLCCLLRHPDRHRGSGHRHQGIGQSQLRHRDCEADDRGHLSCSGRLLPVSPS